MYTVVKFIVAVPCALGLLMFLFLHFGGSNSSVFHGIKSAVNLKPGPRLHHTRKVVFMGPPGVGKSTYGKLLAAKWQTPFITMSALLSEASGEHAETIKRHVAAGSLVPDDIVWEILEKRLSKRDAKNGFFLDGFPRSVKQAEYLDAHVTMDAVLELNLPDTALEAILLGRRVCKCPKETRQDCPTKSECGNGFNVATIDPSIGLHFPPLKPKNWEESKNTCGCGGTLEPRADDTKDIIDKRISAYRAASPPLIQHYKGKGIFGRFEVKNGLNDLDAIEKTIMAALLQLNVGGNAAKGKPSGRHLLGSGDDPFNPENALHHQHTL
jgi:adenylate kinase